MLCTNTYWLLRISIKRIIFGLFISVLFCSCDHIPGRIVYDPNACTTSYDEDCDCYTNVNENNEMNPLLSQNFYNENYSVAQGTPDNGTLDNGINLLDFVVPGYYHYLGTESANVDDWGTQALIWMIEIAGRNFESNYGTARKFGVGDLSLQGGGQFCWMENGANKCHTYHQNGLDADFRYVRIDAFQTGVFVTDAEYDKAASQSLLNYLIEAGNSGNSKIRCGVVIAKFYLGDSSELEVLDPAISVIRNADHNNHFHMQIADPD